MTTTADKPTAETPAKKTAAKKTTTRRARDAKAVERAVEKQSEEMTEEITVPIPEEEEQWFRSPGFQRMRTDWTGEDAAHMQRLQGAIDRRLFEMFTDAFAVMSDLYDTVREQAVDPNSGELLVDPSGFKVWARDPVTGAYVEDWTTLTTRQKENFLHRITTALFEWEQRAETLRTEALFAKGVWTERFAIEYDAPMSGTIEDRTAVGNIKSAEDRYFALMVTSVSRKADALVRTMNNLALRLRDTLTQ